MEAELAHWVPPSILTAVAVTALGVAWKLVTGKLKEMVDELKACRIEINSMDKKMGAFATFERLGSMGDRFDTKLQDVGERQATIEKDIAVLQGALATLQETIASKTKGRRR